MCEREGEGKAASAYVAVASRLAISAERGSVGPCERVDE